MIATLKGVVSEKVEETVVIDCGGVGYGVLMCVDDFVSVQSGDELKVYIYENIKENNHDLYGFINLETKRMFELLLSVNGVGPKMALSILSVGSLDEVRRAIASGDIKYISQANGVGKRVAERVVVDLKDKLGIASSEDATQFLHGAPADSDDEAVQGLIALGFSASDAGIALKDVDKSLSTEERIKQALKSRF